MCDLLTVGVATAAPSVDGRVPARPITPHLDGRVPARPITPQLDGLKWEGTCPSFCTTVRWQHAPSVQLLEIAAVVPKEVVRGVVAVEGLGNASIPSSWLIL